MNFPYDVFLSHSSKDKAIVRGIAERLRKDGLKVWFEEWETKPKATKAIRAKKFEEGLEHSRVLVLCLSANAFGSDWAQLESGTFRFRDPLNKERRFLPLCLDDAPIKRSLAQFLYINWLPAEREQEYAKLLGSCLAAIAAPVARSDASDKRVQWKAVQLEHELAEELDVNDYAFSADQERVLTAASDNLVRLWDVKTGRCLRVLAGHGKGSDWGGGAWAVAWGKNQNWALSASMDNTMRLWDIEAGQCLRVFKDHSSPVQEMAWSPEGHHILSAGSDGELRLWALENAHSLRAFKGHTGRVLSVAWSEDGLRAISGSEDNTVRLWDIETGQCLGVLSSPSLEGEERDHGITGAWSVVWSGDGARVISSSRDNTVRSWDIETGRCLRVLEGHTDRVVCIASSAGHGLVLTGSEDKTVRLRDVDKGRCLLVFEGHSAGVRTVAWSIDGSRAFSADGAGGIRVWDLWEFITEARAREVTTPGLPLAPVQVQYTNAKVLLVGESGAGKTGLSKRLALNDWQPSDSTVGAWATQWKLEATLPKGKVCDGIEREIWLWDFGGQADQRLIHQLYMDETALAVLVFDGQKEDLFETLGQWDRDLTRASRKEFAKLLVAGRVDAGGLRLSRSEVEKFAAERKFRDFLETSAKTGLRCEELKQAILDAIPWDELPCRTTEVLFKRLKEEIIALKDAGRVLLRFNELRETLQLRLARKADIPVRQDEEAGRNARLTVGRFTDEELRAVLTLLASPGVVWELAFGSWVLLQPERINAYAQAVIRTLQADEHQRGCLMEERVLKGDLMYESSMTRLEGDEERFVLLAMHQTLVERGLCFRQPTDKGNLLIFPSYYRRERPDLVQHPAVLVNYQFEGFLDEVYATLVVRLHHTEAFNQEQLWKYAADFKTKTGKQLGLKLTRRGPGKGNLEVFFDAGIEDGEKIIFSKYIHEHLLQNARDVVRFRHYACKHCGTQVGNREEAMNRLNTWLEVCPPQHAGDSGFKIRKSKDGPPTIICVKCETRRVPLWDDLEQAFASPETQQRVRDMQEEAKLVLDNESKERVLVGEVISTVALAGQICREKNVSDHGIDMEIEFKDDTNEATGELLFLQLKSGNSYLRERRADGAEVFTIRDERHDRYWRKQKVPVMLVIRNTEGEVRWMEIRDYLRRESDGGKKPVKEIIFSGERFDVMSVRRWRERMFAEKTV